MKTPKITSVVIEQPQQMAVAVEVVGTASLIQNKFDQKALEQMLRKHMGLTIQKEAKKPGEVIERATIRNLAGVVCIPPTAFKKAMLSAAAQVKTLKKTQIRAQVFIEGGSIPIQYSRMVPRMDMVRTSGIGRTPDVRFRPCFEDWSARIVLLFSDNIPVQTVVDLLNRAGNVGVGEWRPEKDGNFGTFSVKRNITDPSEVEEIRKACRSPIPPLVIPEWAMNAELTPEILAKVAKGDAEGETEEEK